MLITNTLQLKSGLMKKLCLIAGVLPPPSGHNATGRTRSMFLGYFVSWREPGYVRWLSRGGDALKRV